MPVKFVLSLRISKFAPLLFEFDRVASPSELRQVGQFWLPWAVARPAGFVFSPLFLGMNGRLLGVNDPHPCALND